MADKKPEHLHITLDPDMRAAVRKWRHANEIESEAVAIRRLIQRGLDAEAAAQAKPPPRK